MATTLTSAGAWDLRRCGASSWADGECRAEAEIKCGLADCSFDGEEAFAALFVAAAFVGVVVFRVRKLENSRGFFPPVGESVLLPVDVPRRRVEGEAPAAPAAAGRVALPMPPVEPGTTRARPLSGSLPELLWFTVGCWVTAMRFIASENINGSLFSAARERKQPASPNFPSSLNSDKEMEHKSTTA